MNCGEQERCQKLRQREERKLEQGDDSRGTLGNLYTSDPPLFTFGACSLFKTVSSVSFVFYKLTNFKVSPCLS